MRPGAILECLGSGKVSCKVAKIKTLPSERLHSVPLVSALKRETFRDTFIIRAIRRKARKHNYSILMSIYLYYITIVYRYMSLILECPKPYPPTC